MKQLVVMPGGFHPFHAGHLALYQSAEQAFPGADVKVAATNDTSARPFPFALKEKLAQLAGVPPGKFYQVKSPFRADEITKSYNPADTQLIFVRSEKDATKPPVAGAIKKDGTPAYLQPISDDMAPMTQHAYMAYLPTVEFGPGMTSATEIRSAWPTLNPKRKSALVMSLYPATQSNPKLAANVVGMLDTAMGAEAQNVAEGFSNDMSTQDMITYLRQHHDKNLHQDYLNHLTSTNNKFVLKHIPLTSIRTELSGLDREKVEKYKQMDFAKAPPIVVGSDGNILDGYHRATVAKALSIPTIKAYVGVKGQQGVDEASNQTNDSELNAIKNYAKRHYPNLAADPESAFDKWVQRSLMHSNVDDHEMDQKIRRMAAEIAGLKTKIQSLKQQANDSADYLDESR